MKFDMNEAWNRAVALFRANRDLVLVTAGVFFVLPWLALLLALPEMIGEAPPPDAGPEAMAAFVRSLPAALWLTLVAVVLAQWAGTLGLLALVGDQGRPTLAAALKRGLVALVPYAAAQLLVTIGLQVIAVPVQAGVAATGMQALQVVSDLLLIAASLYLSARFALSGAVMVLEQAYNPIRALRRSWTLTQGNGWRLAAFYVLVAVAFMVVGAIVFLVLTLPFSLGGAQAANIGASFVLAAIVGTAMACSMAITASAYRQLANGGAGKG